MHLIGFGIKKSMITQYVHVVEERCIGPLIQKPQKKVQLLSL